MPEYNWPAFAVISALRVPAATKPDAGDEVSAAATARPAARATGGGKALPTCR